MAETPEPWLRGTLDDVPAVTRAVLHALELAEEDLKKWCGALSEEELHAQPAGMASVAFHVRHIARSVDRLLSYAEGRGLNPDQFAALASELDPDGKREQIFEELTGSMDEAHLRLRALAGGNLEETRTVGSKKLPTTLGGLLVHVADHTQRHVGQAITTAKIVRAGAAYK